MNAFQTCKRINMKPLNSSEYEASPDTPGTRHPTMTIHIPNRTDWLLPASSVSDDCASLRGRGSDSGAPVGMKMAGDLTTTIPTPAA